MFRSTVALLSLVGCIESAFVPEPGTDQGPQPDIQVTPSLTYGTLSMSETEVQTFEVQNIGAATLHVSNIVIGTGLGFTVTAPEVAFDLEPGASRDVEVTFTPMGANENYGQVLVASDDPDTAEATVDLLGFGAVPELSITPETFVFGDTLVPCGDSVELVLENVGTEALTITAFDYTSAGMLALDEASLPALPLTLQVGEKASVMVDFAAATAAGDTGRLDVTSNDPREVVSADQSGEGSYEDEATETFTEPGVPPVDVLMLVDNSCSMEDDNTDDVRNGMPQFVAELQNVADWQMMLVTQDSGCSATGIMDPRTNNPENLLINNAFQGGGGMTESLLGLAGRALGQTGPGQCNEGFLRPGALLHVIVMSDEREQSGQSGEYWVSQYETYVASPDYVKVSGVLDLNRNCGDGSGPGGYEEAVDATGGAKLNICNANWGSQLSDIASEVLAGIRTYNLSDVPDPMSVEVTVNGRSTTDFSVSANNVTINNPPVGEGDVVEIHYGIAAECD